MSTFRIEFDPPVPAPWRSYSEISLDRLPYEQIYRAFIQEYDTIYWIDDVSFRYYPASILTVINDIHSEWELIKRRESHQMTLSGYAVLDLFFTREGVQFRHNVGPVGRRRSQPVGATFGASKIETSFKLALDSLLCLVGYKSP
jgi:hypothetical protein